MAHRVDRDTECCAWIKHSDGCAIVKKGCLLTLLAVTIIALAIGVILALAQQGYPLAGFNTIGSMIPPAWIYLGIGILSAGLLLNIVLMIAQAKSQKL